MEPGNTFPAGSKSELQAGAGKTVTFFYGHKCLYSGFIPATKFAYTSIISESTTGGETKNLSEALMVGTIMILPWFLRWEAVLSRLQAGQYLLEQLPLIGKSVKQETGTAMTLCLGTRL